MSMIKYRVHEVAKDFNTTSKVITQILTDYATTPKNHMQRKSRKRPLLQSLPRKHTPRSSRLPKRRKKRISRMFRAR